MNVHGNVHAITCCGTIGREHVNVVNVWGSVPGQNLKPELTQKTPKTTRRQYAIPEMIVADTKCINNNWLSLILEVPGISDLLLISNYLGGEK